MMLAMNADNIVFATLSEADLRVIIQNLIGKG